MTGGGPDPLEDLLGLEASEARAALEAMGLRVRQVEADPSPPRPEAAGERRAVRIRRTGEGECELMTAQRAQPSPSAARGPVHVAIIMDGNGRWARQHGLPRALGHRAGVRALRPVVRACPDLGIKVLTVYGFSTENWSRPPMEVTALMHLLVEFLRREVEELHRQGVRLMTIGDRSALPEEAREELGRAIERTAGNERLTLCLALSYGGRDEMVRAIRRLARRVRAGELEPEAIGEAEVTQALDTAGLPDPDLIIRCSGEQRISNFLLWQCAYAEFWAPDVYWPDFTPEHLRRAVETFAQRERRFGGLRTDG